MRLLDAHCDTITRVMRQNGSLLDHDSHINLQKLSAFDAPVIFFAVFIDRGKASRLFENFVGIYGFLEDQIKKNSGIAAMGRSVDEIKVNLAAGKISAVPAIEEGGILEGSMQNLYYVHNMGIRYITLTWNYVNEIGEPSAINGGGLSKFGHDLVLEMNRLGILVDVSHLSEEGFWDVHSLADGPFIASHSNSKALCGHHRNLTDDQLKALGEKGGCVGVNINPPFLVDNAGKDGKITVIDDVCRHLDHMLKLAGEDSVGLGTDFDGIGSTPVGLEDAAALPSFREVCLKRYGEALTDKIFFDNFMRVLETTKR